MSLSLECYGLQRWLDEDDVPRLVSHAAEAGVKIPAYSGVYCNEHYVSLQVIAGRNADSQTEKMNVTSAHIHNATATLCRCRVLRDITPEESSGLDRRILAETVYGKKFVTVIDVMNADVLPSYAPGEIIELQMIGKARQIRFYSDIKELGSDRAWTEDTAGAKEYPLFCPEPFRYFQRRAGTDSMPPTDDDTQVCLAGTVAGRYFYSVELPAEYGRKAVTHLVSCQVRTCFGNIALMVPREKKDLFRSGDAFSAVCTLQGDTLIGEYDMGMVTDEKNNLMALRYAFASGRVKRLLPVLSPNCELHAEAYGETALGPEDITERLAEYCGQLTDRGTVYTMYGAAEEAEQNGERCVIVGLDGDSERHDLLYVYMKCGGDGKICSIRLTDTRYGRYRRYRSWIEMAQEELRRKGISPAALKREKAAADFLNRSGAHDELTGALRSVLEDGAVLEYGTQKYEGADQVLAFLESLSRAVSSDAGFRARPVYIAQDTDLLGSSVKKIEKKRAVALFSRLDEGRVFRFLVPETDPVTGKVRMISTVTGSEYLHTIDHYEEWDPADVRMITG